MDSLLQIPNDVRGMYTSSAINFMIFFFGIGGFVMKKIVHRPSLIKLVVMLSILGFMTFEVFASAQNKENDLKLLQIIPKETTSFDFRSNIRKVKAKYHPDSRETGDSELFIKIQELEEGLQSDFDRKVESYYWYGDTIDMSNKNELSQNALSSLEMNHGMNILAFYIMILLLSLLFFLNSSKKSMLRTVTVVVCFVLNMCGELMIGYIISPEEEGEVTLDFASVLKGWLDTPYATIPELANCFRLFFVIQLAFFYFYGVAFCLKDEDQLIFAAKKYYSSLHRTCRKVEARIFSDRNTLDQTSSLLFVFEGKVHQFLRDYRPPDRLFKFLHSAQQFILYSILAGGILFHLYTKNGAQFEQWLETED